MVCRDRKEQCSPSFSLARKTQANAVHVNVNCNPLLFSGMVVTVPKRRCSDVVEAVLRAKIDEEWWHLEKVVVCEKFHLRTNAKFECQCRQQNAMQLLVTWSESKQSICMPVPIGGGLNRHCCQLETATSTCMPLPPLQVESQQSIWQR